MLKMLGEHAEGGQRCTKLYPVHLAYEEGKDKGHGDSTKDIEPVVAENYI